MLVTANIFQPLIDVFQSVLVFFHNSLGIEWGWAIVLLTICVRAALIPLTLKQIKSMVRLQALSPLMKEIQAKYKEDKQRQQQEMMKLYKEQGVNPFGSCLPLVAQLPVFVSLYYMLRQSLRVDICPTVQPGYSETLHKVVDTSHLVPCGPHGGASFLFIPDLTDKATGATLIVLLVLYVGTQLASTIMMSASQTDPNMRRVMMFMPLIFVLVVIRFPAGVLVYWITTNTWTIGQQYFVKRRMGPLKAATVAAATSGNGAAAQAPVSSASSGGGGRSSKPRAEKLPAGKGATGKGATGKGATGKSASAAGGNGSSTGGGLGSLIRQKVRPDEKPSQVATAERTGPPPKPPRKKKKRSGRRR